MFRIILLAVFIIPAYLSSLLTIILMYIALGPDGARRVFRAFGSKREVKGFMARMHEAADRSKRGG